MHDLVYTANLIVIDGRRCLGKTNIDRVNCIINLSKLSQIIQLVSRGTKQAGTRTNLLLRRGKVNLPFNIATPPTFGPISGVTTPSTQFYPDLVVPIVKDFGTHI